VRLEATRYNLAVSYSPPAPMQKRWNHQEARLLPSIRFVDYRTINSLTRLFYFDIGLVLFFQTIHFVHILDNRRPWVFGQAWRRGGSDWNPGSNRAGQVFHQVYLAYLIRPTQGDMTTIALRGI
jgi:hypothetical protein